MRFIGLDLAWSTRNPTGAAVIEGDENTGQPVAAQLLGDDDTVIDFVQTYAGNEPAIVAIDAPLHVPNETGRRPAEAEIGAMFARYQAGAHPANRQRLAANGVVRGEAIVARLEAIGFTHRAEVEPHIPVRQVIEVFPHPAMIALFNLQRTIKYKAKAGRSHEQRLVEFARYQELLRSLETHEPALVGADSLLSQELITLNKARLKDYEDVLDGLLCAYIAYYLWQWGMTRSRVFGTFEQGYITTPVPQSM
jgi:predicted RNase H-like nuclease